jgi:Xaa-Pro aminopeptidase
VANTPVALGFALLGRDGHATLFMDAAKIPAATRAWLGNRVQIADRAALPQALAAYAGRMMRVDRLTAPVWFAQTLRAVGAKVAEGSDPCLLPKACKNSVERQGARDAHALDAVALCRFLHWLDGAQGESEMSAAAKLVELRAAQPGFRGESFPAISGAGENGAVIHYRVSPETNRPIRPNEAYLIDSGAQYECGTTDVTRTVWTGPETPPALLTDRFTRVLKGHIAIATLAFPAGVCGAHLDSFARQALWQVGLDYDHGTGHGVGSFLSVHEGPVSLSRAARMVPLAEGMILSNEPGFMNKVRKPGRPDLFYVRPHEIRILFAGDAEAEFHAKIEHLFAAGPSARLTLRFQDSRDTLDADITRLQLEEMGLSEGDEVGLKLALSIHG